MKHVCIVLMIYVSLFGQSLNQLIKSGLQNNPMLKSYVYTIKSIENKSESMSYLPDPVIQTTYFANEIVTANGPQVAQIGVMQKTSMVRNTFIKIRYYKKII